MFKRKVLSLDEYCRFSSREIAVRAARELNEDHVGRRVLVDRVPRRVAHRVKHGQSIGSASTVGAGRIVFLLTFQATAMPKFPRRFAKKLGLG